MEYRPTITYSFSESADENLFLTLSTHLRKILQNHLVKWKRSYGRNAHTLSLDVKFLPLTSALLKRNDLVTRPYFHVFWTDCNDIDHYRTTVKSEMASWLSELFGNDIFDWLIIVVTGDGTSRGSKPKLSLPRTSLADKIKADFCSKAPDRLHVLQDPMKDSSRTSDSWSSLAAKVGNFAAVCLENAVTRYEDRVRAERERRNEKSWNFCSYFVMQEELAFMYEMLCLHEEALIQYNELDAMFTQYLLNAHAGDVAHWLSSFTSTITRWRSLSLWRRIDGDARQTLIEGNATLIDVRNYLFARHCYLLFAIGDMKRVTELMHAFLHSTILELDILEIELPPGAKECWVFMSCMELTQALERNRKQLQNEHADDPHDAESRMKISYDQLRLETANLWDLARLKLIKLGELCGLMPDIETTSDHLQTVVNLIAGMGDEEERGGLAKSPSLILREALSSKENFRAQYFELSELAMGTYKHTGRYRSARNIGRDLADFYMRSNEAEKAESYLVDCVRMYSNESWPLLATNVSEKLAECYKRLCNVRRYIRLCCTLMCDKYIPAKRRSYYCEELNSHSTDLGDHNLPLLLAVFANVTAVQFIPAQTTFRYKSSPHIVLHVRSDAPKTIKFHSIQVSLRYQEANQENFSLSNNEVLEEEESEIDAYSYATFSSDEEGEQNESNNHTSSKDNVEVSRIQAKKAAIKRNHVHRKRRFVSSSSYDSIFAIQQKTTLGPDGFIQLVTMEEPFSQPSKCMANTLPSRINITYESEEKSEEILWAGITCRTAKQLLRRQDSYQSLRSINASAANVVMEAYDEVVQAKEITLKPGENTIRVDVDTTKPGEYTLKQLRFTVNKLHFVLPRILPLISYTVTREPPTLTLEHEPRIFCCMKQAINITIASGDFVLDETSESRTLSVSIPNRLRILSITSVTVKMEDGDAIDHPTPEIGHEGTKYFFDLPNAPIHSTITVSMDCVCCQPDTVHDIDPRHHRRTHSAPPSTARKPQAVNGLRAEEDGSNLSDSSFEKVDCDGVEKSGFFSSSPKTPSIRIGGSGDSPVKKFLSFVREVADRVDNKSNRTGDKDLASEYETKDDFLEVTLEGLPDSKPNGKVSTFPQIRKKRLLEKVEENIGFNKSHSATSLASNSSSEASPESTRVNSVTIKKSASLSGKHGASRSNADLVHPRINITQEWNEYDPDEESKLLCNMTFFLPWKDIPSVPTSATFFHLLEFSHAVRRFYSTEHEGSTNVVHRLVVVTVDNVSLSKFTLANSCLRVMSSGQATVAKLAAKSDTKLGGHQSTTFAWMLTLPTPAPSWCNAQFNADVHCEDDVTTSATYKFELENIQTIYVVSTVIGDGNAKLVSGEMTTLTVTVKRNRVDSEHEHTRSGQQLLMFQVIDMRGRWAVCGKSTGILSIPLLPAVDGDSESDDCTASVTLEVMPLIGGWLHRPNVVLQRYLKRRSSEFDEQLSSTDSPVLKPPRLMDFRNGEVLNIDESQQVRVYDHRDEEEVEEKSGNVQS